MKLFTYTDKIAEVGQSGNFARWLERIAFFFLCLMVISAPHSIAASQTSFILGILFSFVRLFVNPRPKIVKTPLDFALLGLFFWSALICFFAYYPLVSADKLRGVGLFLIFYFVINNLRSLRSLRFLVLALIISCMVSVLWTPIERLLGRGVEIHGISLNSPLKKALLWEGDTLLKANGKKITTPEELVVELEKTEISKVEFYRPDFDFTVDVKRSELLGGDALQKLGIESWKKSRNWRASGFFSHYVTFAEVLQLIISLVFGLFVASIRTKNRQNFGDLDRSDEGDKLLDFKSKFLRFLPFSFSPFLLFCLIAMAFALLLTVTRASQLSFLISAATIVLLTGNRKIIFTLAAVILPVALAGLFFLQQSRQVGFFDKSDDSTTYRMTVYREGLNLWLDNPRHFFFGIGMDATTNKEFREKWHLFDDGKLPISHFHSTPIQLLVDRGLFALVLWLLVLTAYVRTLYRALQKLKKNGFVSDSNELPRSRLLSLSADKFRNGVILGCFGATIGFFTSSLVHYNFGDGEVAMVLFLLFGFGIIASKSSKVDSELPVNQAS